MKKFCLAFIAIAMTFSVSLHAQKKNDSKAGTKTETVAKDTSAACNCDVQTSQFAVIGSIYDFNALLTTIDNPDATHRDIQSIKKWISDQVKYQADLLAEKKKKWDQDHAPKQDSKKE